MKNENNKMFHSERDIVIAIKMAVDQKTALAF